MSWSPEQAEIIRAYREAQRDELIPEEAILVGGAAMVLYGMKELTDDMDLVISWSAYEELAERQSVIRTGYRAFGTLRFRERAHFVSICDRGTLDVMLAPDEEDFAVDFAKLWDTAEVIEGIRVIHPELLLAWKRALRREKDAADALLIVEWLKRRALPSAA